MRTQDRKSPRLREFDYRTPGAYFVTICTFERACILDDKAVRETLDWSWRSIGKYAKGVRPGEFVVMPNHVHGIVWLTNDPTVGTQHVRSRNEHPDERRYRLTPCCPGRPRAASLQHPAAYIGPVAESLGAIVRGFKSAATKRINRIRRTPGAKVWQDRYHERVIRDERHLFAAQEYIADNQRRWAEDPNHPRNWDPPQR